MSAFFFYEHACEISLMVSPLYRKQHIALQLIQKIIPLLEARDMETIIFSKPHNNSHWLQEPAFLPSGGECQMRRISNLRLNMPQPRLHIRMASMLDIPILRAIDASCFPMQSSTSINRFQSLLNDVNYSIFIANLGGIPVGKAHLHHENERAWLSDVAIIPRVQNRGYGSSLLAYCINYVIDKQKHEIYLDVETKNQQAINLYLRLGFDTYNSYDFWKISRINLTEFIQKH